VKDGILKGENFCHAVLGAELQDLRKRADISRRRISL